MDFVLFRMLAVQPAGILDQSTLEGERHRQKQSVKARKVVAFADKGSSGEQNEPFAARDLAVDCFAQGLSLAFSDPCGSSAQCRSFKQALEGESCSPSLLIAADLLSTLIIVFNLKTDLK